MKLKIEAPHDHLDVPESTTRRLCEVLIPDPLKWVQLDEYPKLRLIVTPSTGTNHIDLNECERRGIKVLSLLDDRFGLDMITASSEFTFLLMLMALRHGAWRQWKRYERDDDMMRGHELHGKKVGLVGYGRIGKNVANYCTAFGAKWDYADPQYRTGDNLLAIFEDSDIVVICCSLNDETKGMITRKHLNALRPGAILVNTARAEIIREEDLITWARQKKNVYATDVLHNETMAYVSSPLLGLSNCIITPHIAGTTYESQQKAMQIALRLAEREA